MIFFLKDMGRKLWLSSGETGCVCQVVRDHCLKEFLIHCSASACLAKGSASDHRGSLLSSAIESIEEDYFRIIW